MGLFALFRPLFFGKFSGLLKSLEPCPFGLDLLDTVSLRFGQTNERNPEIQFLVHHIAVLSNVVSCVAIAIDVVPVLEPVIFFGNS